MCLQYMLFMAQAAWQEGQQKPHCQAGPALFGLRCATCVLQTLCWGIQRASKALQELGRGTAMARIVLPCSFQSLCMCCTATLVARIVPLHNLGAVAVLRLCTAVSDVTLP